MVELPEAAEWLSAEGEGRLMNYEMLPVATPLSGVFWTWVVPVSLFSIAFAATWLLYRHFARPQERGRRGESQRKQNP